MEKKPRKNLGGRPRKHEREAGEKVHLGIRVAPELKKRIEEITTDTGRSQSQEAEHRLARSFDRQDLLPEVLSLSYGREAAGLLMAFGLMMEVASDDHVVTPAADQGQPWTDNPDAINTVRHAIATLLDAANPKAEGQVAGTGERGIEIAEMLIGGLKGSINKMGRQRDILRLRDQLGPIALRMVKAIEKRKR